MDSTLWKYTKYVLSKLPWVVLLHHFNSWPFPLITWASIVQTFMTGYCAIFWQIMAVMKEHSSQHFIIVLLLLLNLHKHKTEPQRVWHWVSNSLFQDTELGNFNQRRKIYRTPQYAAQWNVQTWPWHWREGWDVLFSILSTTYSSSS